MHQANAVIMAQCLADHRSTTEFATQDVISSDFESELAYIANGGEIAASCHRICRQYHFSHKLTRSQKARISNTFFAFSGLDDFHSFLFGIEHRSFLQQVWWRLALKQVSKSTKPTLKKSQTGGAFWNPRNTVGEILTILRIIG